MKLGVYNGDSRTYEDVEVAVSSDGSTYGTSIVKDVQSSNTFTLPQAYQFIKIQMQGSTANSWSHLTEVTLINNGSEFVLTTGHNAPTVLGDGIGANGASTGYYGLDASGLLVIDLGQPTTFNAVKLGVFNGDNRIYRDVEVSLSNDGVTYGPVIQHDVQNAQIFF